MRILIVGAGPTGLTAAVELARHGIVADVIDGKEQASTFSRAVGILPKSLEILAPSDVSSKLIHEGIKIHQACGYFDNKLILNLSIKDGHPVHDYLIALAQDRTETILQDAFTKFGGIVHYQTKLTGLKQNGRYVLVTTNTWESRKYDYVIGADGVRSATRNFLSLEYPGFDLPETWSIADVYAENWQHPESFTFCALSKGRVVVVVPLETNRYRVISNTKNTLETLPLELAVTDIKRQAQFTISIRQVKQYCLEHVYLAGDAAHCHSPVGGRGMNLGIADAAELVERMIAGNLDGYSESRHVEGAKTIKLSERVRKIMTSDSTLARSTLKVGLKKINRSKTLQKIVARALLRSIINIVNFHQI